MELEKNKSPIKKYSPRRLKSSQIDSALIAYRPTLKGFFYSKIVDFIMRNTVLYLSNLKTSQQIANLETPYGTSGLFVLPYTLKELKKMSRTQREDVVRDAVILAIQNGAQRIAFAGQLSSCLNYCEEFSNKDLKHEQEKLTTGHSITGLAVASTFEEVLNHTHCQKLAVIGTGSIGQSSTILLLEKVMKKKPLEIILCDLKKKTQKVQKFSQELTNRYKIKSSPVFYDDSSFQRVYEADMFLGASSAPKVLNANHLKPGSILIDDSFPPVIDVTQSINRMKFKNDVLILNGGKLTLPYSKIQSLSPRIPQFFVSLFTHHMGSEGLPGCWLEAVLFSWGKKQNLLSKDPYLTHLYLTQGLVTPERLLSTWDLKLKLDLKIPSLHFYKYLVPKSVLQKVYQLREKCL